MLYEFDHQDLDFFQTPVAVAAAPTVSAEVSTEQTDEELLGGIQAQDQGALRTLMSRHTPLLRTIVSRVVHCDADTEDVLQEVFIEIWNRAAAYDRSKGKALGWVVTMARRRAIDRVRRRQTYDRAGERLRLEVENNAADRFESGADENAERSDRAAMLREVLASLPEAQRQALELAYYRGLSQREIAKTTGIPLGTIKTRLELAVRKVRSAVLQMGGAQEWSPAAMA